MNLRPLSRREKVLLFASLTLLFCSAVYAWGVEPLLRRWRLLEDQIRLQEMRLVRDQRVLARAQVIRNQYARHANSLKIESADEDAVGQLLQEVDLISGTVGTALRVRSLKPQAAADRGAYEVYGAEAEVEGGLRTICRFIYLLEQSTTGLRVARLQLAPVGQGENQLEGRMLITRIAVAQK